MLEYSWAIEMKVNSMPINEQQITPFKLEQVLSDNNAVDDNWLGQANEIKKTIINHVAPIKRDTESSYQNTTMIKLKQ